MKKGFWIAFAAAVALSSLWSATASAVDAGVPLELIADAQPAEWRATFDLSPAGTHAAHVMFTIDAAGRSSRIRIIDVHTGAITMLGGGASSAWAPVWSPDSRTLAYFSDEGGQPGLWTWNAAGGERARVPGLIVRSQDRRETVQWADDSRRVLCKIASGSTTAQVATAASPSSAAAAPATSEQSKQPAVPLLVRRTQDAAQAMPSAPAAVDRHDDTEVALVDLQAGTVRRLGKTSAAAWAGLSPDNKFVAYPTLSEPRMGKSSLAVVALASGERYEIALSNDARRGYGWSWSPDGAHLAYRYFQPRSTPDAPPEGEVSVVSLRERSVRRVGSARFIPSNNQNTMLWDAQGTRLYVIGTDEPFRDYQHWIWQHQDRIWMFHVRSAELRPLPGIDAQSITSMVSFRRRPVAWSMDDDRSLWMFTEPMPGADRTQAGLYKLDLASGRHRHLLWADAGPAEASVGDSRTGEIQFNSTDGLRPSQISSFDTQTERTRVIAETDPKLAAYSSTSPQILEYRHRDGSKLRAALLLPPDAVKRDGPWPLVVWLWGHENASKFLTRQALPSNNVLALTTRGYAVLVPDMPQGHSLPMRDIHESVTLGVDAALATGKLDEQRMAVIGYSYGSYCVLSVITQSERFKAAIASGLTVPPDLTVGYLMNLMGSGGKVRPDYEYRTTRLSVDATPWSHRDRFVENSPLFLFDRISAPLLFGQGKDDGLVVPDLILAALTRLGKSAELRLYDDDHAISKRANVIDFWHAKIRFLDQHLNVSRDRDGTMLLQDRLSSAAGDASALPENARSAAQ